MSTRIKFTVLRKQSYLQKLDVETLKRRTPFGVLLSNMGSHVDFLLTT